MSLINKLLGRLTRKFDRSPGPVLGLRLSYLVGTMAWNIADDVLTTQVVGGIGANLTVDLTQYTLGTLADYLAAQPGYVVLFLETSMVNVSALALVEGSGALNISNGDHLSAATNPNWAYMSAMSAELMLARVEVVNALLEMSTTTADTEWLDLLGSYYAVPRGVNEPDSQYSPRIPAEVILPRQNNVAIELALQTATGQSATCTDAIVFGNPLPLFDGSIHFDGTHFFNASASRIYNLFDLTIGYALLGNATPADYATMIRSQVERLRAAGTHLRNLTLTGSVVGDTVPRPSDNLVEVLSTQSFVSSVVSSDSALAVFIKGWMLSAPVSSDAAAANLTVVEGATATLAGASGFFASPVQRAQAAATLAGAGNMTTLLRASTATYFDVAGLIQTALPNVLRPNFDPITHVQSGNIIEGATTNFVPNGNSPFSAPWVVQPIQNSAGTTTDIPGLFAPASVIKHVRNTNTADNNVGSRNIAGLNIGDTIIGSIWVYIPSSVTVTGFTFNINGVSSNVHFDGVLANRDQWQRVWASGVLTANKLDMVPRLTGATGDIVYSTCWQLETGQPGQTTPTSYIPTVNAIATRAADIITGPGLLARAAAALSGSGHFTGIGS